MRHGTLEVLFYIRIATKGHLTQEFVDKINLVRDCMPQGTDIRVYWAAGRLVSIENAGDVPALNASECTVRGVGELYNADDILGDYNYQGL